MHTVSVVVCTRNRPGHLQTCVASILKQSVKPQEIIIADDGSDERIDIVRILNTVLAPASGAASGVPAAHSVKIKYVRSRRRQGIVRSRNLGISVAKGSVVAFIDDDGYAHRDWVKNLLKAYRHKGIAGVGGPIVEVGRRVETRQDFRRLSYITRYGDIKHNYRVREFRDTKHLRPGYVRFLMGGNMSFRKDVLIRLHGFDAQYKGTCYREETDLCMRASRIGRIVFEPSVVTWHNTAGYGGTRDITHLEQFLYWYFRNTVLLFFRHFDMRNAMTKTWRQCRKYLRRAAHGTIKVNREYLIGSGPWKVMLAVLRGTVAGMFAGLVFDKRLWKMVYRHPEYATLLTIVLAGTTFQITDHEIVENVVEWLGEL